MGAEATTVSRAEIEDFLFREADLLDNWKLDEWLTLLTDDAAQRDPGVVVDLTQSGQSRQGARRLDREHAHRLVGRHHRIGGTASQRQGHLGGLPDTVQHAVGRVYPADTVGIGRPAHGHRQAWRRDDLGVRLVAGAC